MGSMEDRIYIHYQDTLHKAERIKEDADRMEQLCVSRLKELSDGIQTVWTGDSSDVYKQKLYRMIDKLRQRAKDLRNTADGIERSAKRLYDVEMFGTGLFGN